MMLIPAELQRGKVTIFLIFEDEGIDRIKNYDPCNVNVSAIPQHFRDNLTDIIICYGTKEETKAIEDAGREGNFRLMIERIKHLSRNWAFRPDLGDYDGPPKSIFGEIK